jgi:predicted nucleic-acid-binding Zn-ribbon protein
MYTFRKSEPQTIAVKGHELKCPVCGNVNFWAKRVLLNTRLATFFDLDWANRSATCFVCSDCTHISWFLGQL